MTLRVNSAKNIAKREGKREKTESSMKFPKTQWP